MNSFVSIAKAGEIGESFFSECGLPGTFKYVAWFHNWRAIMQHNLGTIWVLRIQGKIVGALGAMLVPDINDGELVATETFWYVLPQYRNSLWSVRLLTNFEHWAVEIGAKRIVMVHLLSHMPEKLKRFYEKRGYQSVEITYAKTLISSVSNQSCSNSRKLQESLRD